jgi:hypothetical protein
MNRVFTVFSCLFLAVLLAAIPPASCEVPSVNIALSLKAEEGASLFSPERLITSLDKELRIRGFVGRMRVLGRGTEEGAPGESLIRVVVRKSSWESQKAFSIPYLLNRYRRVFILEAFMEIPGGVGGMFSKIVEVKSSSAVEAQLISDDRYDPRGNRLSKIGQTTGRTSV